MAAGTLVLTVALYVVVPKGFFPSQDTGVILGISEAPQIHILHSMVERQQASDQRHSGAIRQSQASRPSLASDGTNTTLNSGTNVKINLKPIAEATPAPDGDHRLETRPAKVAGITLYLQPVQDLTVEDRVSRTQFQYTLEDADPEELRPWAPKFVAALQTLPSLRDVGSDQQNQGLATKLVIDRDTASRLGITPQHIDDTLYDAFGQRQVSTMFTQLNQYRVILEVMPEFQKRPRRSTDIYVNSRPAAARCHLNVFTHGHRNDRRRSTISHQGQFPVGDDVLQSGARGHHSDMRWRPSSRVTQDIGLPASIRGSFRARPRRSKRRWRTNRC